MIRILRSTFLCLIVVLYGACLQAQTVFINEFHYDNAGSDVNEGIEIAGPAGTDLTGWALVLYNGSNGTPYKTVNLTGKIVNQQNGYGTVNFLIPGIQNGAPDGIALVDATGNVLQFISYEGELTAVGGPADGLSSVDIGVAEGSSTTAESSLALTGNGTVAGDFTWEITSTNTFSQVNTDQVFGTINTTPVINEFVFNHTGSDTDEFIEVLAGSNEDLSAYSLLIVEGDVSAVGTILSVFELGTTTVDGFYTIPFQNNVFQNGSQTILLVTNFNGSVGDNIDLDTDGVIDVTPWETIVDSVAVSDSGDNDLLYATVVLTNDFDGGTFTVGGASRIPNGASTSSTANWVRNSFNGAGLPSFPDATAGEGEAINSPNSENITASVTPVNDTVVLINELDADTTGSDTLEFLEIYDGGLGNTSLSGLVVVAYNGNSDTVYNTFDLEGFFTNDQGYFVLGNADVVNVDLVIPANSFQNGADAIGIYRGAATTYPNGTPLTLEGLVDAIVYGTDDDTDEALITLLNPGQEQLNENANGSKDSESLQRIPNGAGGVRNTATYVPQTPTPGAANDAIIAQGEILTIAQVRAAAAGDTVTTTGVLTVSDQFNGPAFLQDATGGIAIFDNLVHGENVFAIGDSITVTGTISAFNDLAQISPVNIIEANGPALSLVVPVTITLAQLADYEGQLVRVVNASFPNEGDLLFGNSNFELTDSSGTGQLRIDGNATSLITLTQPSSCDIIGVVGRFNDNFQLLPRIASDIPCATRFESPDDTSDISREDSFDVVAWNIEWFGDENNAPPAGRPMSDEIQRDSVRAVLRRLDADVIAVEEIADDILFAELVDGLEGYDYILSDAVSNPTGTPPFQKLGFIYKTATVTPVKTQALLATIHPLYNGGDASALVDYPNAPDRFYASGRLPFLMTANVTINGTTEQIDLIALHARANGSTQSESRYNMRRFDVEVLKDSLDAQFSDRKIILLGDYNDDVDETVADGVTTTESSFIAYVQDSENYNVVTSVLSDAGFRSFVSRENMIDHIAISNELFNNYIVNSASVGYQFYDEDYAFTASDHFPVSARFLLQASEPLEVVSIESFDVTCFDATDGVAIINVAGGIAPYIYRWSDGQVENMAENLTAGNYNVIITDSIGEELIVENVIISSPAQITFLKSEDVTIFNDYDAGCTTLSVSEVVENSTVSWSTGETTESITFCPDVTTIVDVTVMDEKGCSRTKQIIVTVEDATLGVLENTSITLSNIKIYPNPIIKGVQVSITSAVSAEVHFEVFNISGQQVLTESTAVSQGQSTTELSLVELPLGFYFLKPTVNGVEQEIKVLIKK